MYIELLQYPYTYMHTFHQLFHIKWLIHISSYFYLPAVYLNCKQWSHSQPSPRLQMLKLYWIPATANLEIPTQKVHVAWRFASRRKRIPWIPWRRGPGGCWAFVNHPFVASISDHRKPGIPPGFQVGSPPEAERKMVVWLASNRWVCRRCVVFLKQVRSVIVWRFPIFWLQQKKNGLQKPMAMEGALIMSVLMLNLGLQFNDLRDEFNVN